MIITQVIFVAKEKAHYGYEVDQSVSRPQSKLKVKDKNILNLMIQKHFFLLCDAFFP